MTPIRFTIILAPQSQKRARSRGFIIKGGGKHGQDIARAQTYTDEDQRTEQNKLMALMYEHRPPVPFQGPVALGMRAFLPIPKSKSKKWQAAAMAGEIRPITKPDTDNLVKQITDCANGDFLGRRQADRRSPCGEMVCGDSTVGSRDRVMRI